MVDVRVGYLSDGWWLIGLEVEVADEVTTVETLGDANITMRESPASPSAGQNWPDVHTHADADKQAAERGITFPDGNLTVQEKQDILNGGGA